MGTQGLKRLGEVVNEAMESAVPSDVAVRAGRSTFLAKVHQPTRSFPALVFAVGGGSILVLGFVALWWSLRSTGSGPGFVAGTVAGEVGALLETKLQPLPLTFSEGSHIDLEPRSQLRVAEFGKANARVQLHRGRARLAIAKGKARTWAVEAGPFAVNVTGTRFSVDWQPEKQRMEVVLVEGSVVVTSTCFKGERRMQAPQRLVAACDEPAPLGDTPEARPPAPAMRRLRPAATPPNGRPEPKADSLWWQLVKAGRYEDALLQAKAVGIPGLCRTATAAELLDLGEAARLAGDVASAQAALVSLNRRFPGSPQSALASFNLGRLAFDQKQNYDAAAKHFSRYLQESPRGPLVGDAWGRLLQAYERMLLRDEGARDAAKTDARAYLARYANGPYAALAKRILRQ